VQCPANSFCPGGNADAVPCSAPEGSYCPEGSATADGVACPANRCCPGGSSPPEACPAPPLVAFVAETPPPFMLEWFTHKTASRGVESEPAYMSVHRLGDTSEAGFLEGHYNLPVDGRWKVAFDFFVPKYDGGNAAESIFPNEAISAVSADDAIDCNINGVLKTLKSSADLAGHKQSLEFEVEGQVLTYRFDFLSPSVPSFAHPFITAAEITLIRDRNQAPAGGATGKVQAKCIDAVDGRPIKDNGKVSNGYKKKAWKLDSDPTLSVFKGSTLIAQKDMPKGRYKDQLPVGSYSCMVRHVNFYTTFIKNCDITSQGLQLGDVALSPVLNPGDSRVVLEWGAKPKDLDSYLTVPQGARPDCVINYKNKKCNKNKITQVKLDLDATSHSKRGGKPETTTFGVKVPGKYVFRVSEYKGRDSNGLLNSGAVVNYFSEDAQKQFVVGQDGYVTGINWFVFYLDGATGQAHACDRENCPESLCAGGGYKSKRGGEYIC
jgi:hypothetical protein